MHWRPPGLLARHSPALFCLLAAAAFGQSTATQRQFLSGHDKEGSFYTVKELWTWVWPLPKAGLAFLHAIPPLGNKFHAAKDTGPQGQPTPTHGDYSGAVSFYFGKLP
jgi:hypothetical protein